MIWGYASTKRLRTPGLEFCQEFRVSQVKKKFHNFGFLKDSEIALGGVGIATHFYESDNLYRT
jgi:hypothetical protein